MVVFDDGVAATQVPQDGDVVRTDVLVVGSGPAGSAAALFLATLGINTVMITKYRWTAHTPRAHITNQRTMEIFRDVGIEEQVLQDATPHHLMGTTAFCTSIAGDEIGRIHAWGTGPDRHADYELASPSLNCDIPQTYLEPILVRNAAVRGAQVRFSAEYLSHEQDDDGVTTRVLDRLTGREFTVRSKYLVGADGARSKVAADINLPLEGQMDIAGSMNITFKADLEALVGHRPSVLYWVVQPGANIGGIGAGLVRMVRPWNEWLIVWGFDISKGTPVVSHEDATKIVRDLVGEPNLDVEILGVSLWGNNEQYATTLQSGRVFCAGDAVHKHPPSNGLGSNTSIQDAYNLSWKLAAVLKGQATPSLLESYTEERAPVAKQIVTRANKSGREFGALFEALGIREGMSEAAMREQIEARKEDSVRGREIRERLRPAMELKNYEFNAHGVELGQVYRSAAVLSEPGERPAPARDPELFYEPSTAPGSRLPHAWVGTAARTVSTHDLAPYGAFTLFTGIAGAQAWTAAAQRAAQRWGVDVGVVVVGPGTPSTDLYFDWERLRGVDEDGALLVRPDKHVAWRAQGLPSDPGSDLEAALGAVLGQGQGQGAGNGEGAGA